MQQVMKPLWLTSASPYAVQTTGHSNALTKTSAEAQLHHSAEISVQRESTLFDSSNLTHKSSFAAGQSAMSYLGVTHSAGQLRLQAPVLYGFRVLLVSLGIAWSAGHTTAAGPEAGCGHPHHTLYQLFALKNGNRGKDGKVAQAGDVVGGMAVTVDHDKVAAAHHLITTLASNPARSDLLHHSYETICASVVAG